MLGLLILLGVTFIVIVIAAIVLLIDERVNPEGANI